MIYFRSMVKILFILGLFITLTPATSVAQLTAADKKEVISIFCEKLKQKYVFPDISEKVSSQLQKNLENGFYDTVSSKAVYAQVLTRDIRKISNDLHLKISHDEKVIKKQETIADTPKSAAVFFPFEKLVRENNFGIRSKKILEGNIGYVEIPLFGPIDFCADTIIGAMHFVANTDALIFDLRACRGALDENTLLLFLSYFFPEPVHLSDLYIHEKASVKQNWTYAWVPGKRYLDKPVYVLTSNRTFSGGEAFAYDLQQFKKAVVIGDTTRGGAHPTEFVRLNQSFACGIPYARPVNTVSKTNWEHVGVKPDINIHPDRALTEAHLTAVRSLMANVKENGDRMKLEQLLTKLETIK